MRIEFSAGCMLEAEYRTGTLPKVSGGCLCSEIHFQCISILASVLFVLYREALVV